MDGRRSVISAVVMASALVLSVAPTLAATGDYTVPQTTKVMTYVSGTHLTWTASAQLASDGAAGPAGATLLFGVAGSASGIVETGQDLIAHRAASWVSADGGLSWTEHLTAGASSFGNVVAHGGVLVTTAPNGFWSSTDGATWTRAISGPHAQQQANIAAGQQGFIAFVRNGSSTITRVWRSATGGSTSWVAAPVQGVVSTFCPTSIAATSSRIIAIGFDCTHPSVPRVLISTTGKTWVRGIVPFGLRTSASFLTYPSISFVSRRYLVVGSNSTRTATWVWSTLDGRTWRHVSTMARLPGGFTVDRIRLVVRLAPGWLAVGDRTFTTVNDDAELVAWKSADLVHWFRIVPRGSIACIDASVHQMGQAALVGARLVAVGNPWGIGGTCGETWVARVTP